MKRWPPLVLLALLTIAPAAVAQLTELDAGARASSSPASTSKGPVLPSPSATSSSDKPPPGPALRERNARRSRGGSTASGVLVLTILVGAMGYYVVKRLRR